MSTCVQAHRPHRSLPVSACRHRSSRLTSPPFAAFLRCRRRSSANSLSPLPLPGVLRLKPPRPASVLLPACLTAPLHYHQVAMCYYRLDYYDVSLEILQVYLQHYPDSVTAINLKACNHFRLYNGNLDPSHSLHVSSIRGGLYAFPRVFSGKDAPLNRARICPPGKAAEAELAVLKDSTSSAYTYDNDLIRHNLVVFRCLPPPPHRKHGHAGSSEFGTVQTRRACIARARGGGPQCVQLQLPELTRPAQSSVPRNGEGALKTLPPLVDVIPEARLNLVIYYLRTDEIQQVRLPARARICHHLQNGQRPMPAHKHTNTSRAEVRARERNTLPFLALLLPFCQRPTPFLVLRQAYNLMADFEPRSAPEYILKGVVNCSIGQLAGSREHLKMAQQYFQLVGIAPDETVILLTLSLHPY